MRRREFLRALGIGAAAAALPEFVREPERRIWAVPNTAPVMSRVDALQDEVTHFEVGEKLVFGAPVTDPPYETERKVWETGWIRWRAAGRDIRGRSTLVFEASVDGGKTWARDPKVPPITDGPDFLPAVYGGASGTLFGIEPSEHPLRGVRYPQDFRDLFAVGRTIDTRLGGKRFADLSIPGASDSLHVQHELKRGAGSQT
jgi:hypothetical protein